MFGHLARGVQSCRESEVFTLTLAVGLVVVVAVSLSPLLVGDRRLPASLASAGAGLVVASVLLALPAALLHGPVASRDKSFIAAFVLLLVGGLLLVGAGGDDRRGPDDGDDDPSWWPSFELDFRVYARDRRPLAPRR